MHSSPEAGVRNQSSLFEEYISHSVKAGDSVVIMRHDKSKRTPFDEIFQTTGTSNCHLALDGGHDVWIAFEGLWISFKHGTLSFTKEKFNLQQFWRKDLAPSHDVSCRK